MEKLLQDIRYGLRVLLKYPAFSVVAVIALALGIGANTAIFSVVYGLLLRPLPYRDADRLLVAGLSVLDYRDLKDANQVFDEMAIWASNQYSLTTDSEAQHVLGGVVSPGFFSMLGQPFIGRTFTTDEDRDPLAVLSYDFWQSRFGGDPGVLGETIDLGGRPHAIVGVMPPEFQFPDSQFKLWVPFGSAMSQAPKQEENRQLRIFRCIAHLKPGVSLAQAQTQVNAVASRLEQAYPDTNTGVQITFVSLYDRIVGDVRPALLVLLYAVGFVLLIACANVANLMLARTTARGREISIRIALGAGRWRIARQLITESVLLALVGGALGVLMAVWLIDALPRLSPRDVPRLTSIGINIPVLAFTLTLSLLTGILFGVLPALHASKFNLNEALKEGGKGLSGSRLGPRLRAGLVVVEISLSLVVLIGAGLLIKSFASVLKSDSGFVSDNLMTMSLDLYRIRDTGRRTETLNEIMARVRQLPGVEAVGGSTGLPPVTAQRVTRYAVEGQEPSTSDPEVANFIAVTGDTFSALGTPLIQGRWFDEHDTIGAQRVVIVNQRVAHRLFPDANPIGKRIKLINPEQSDEWREIVGIVGDVKYSGLDDTARTTVYTPFAQTPFLWSYLMVRTLSDPSKFIAAVRVAVATVDSNIVAVNIQPMTNLVSDSVAQRRFYMLLLSGFATLALVLATVGLYGVMSYLVTQRTREIGIRLALGAPRSGVLRLVVGQGMTLTLIGVGIGVASALPLTRVISSLLYGVSATDPATFIGVATILAAVAFAACYLPARRAAKVDPMVALRYE